MQLKKIVIMALAGLLLPQLLWGQADTASVVRKQPYLGLSVGFSHEKVKDQLVMPVKYKGTPFEFRLTYEKLKPKSISTVYLDAILGVLKTTSFTEDSRGGRFRPAEAQFYRFELGYQYLRRFKQFGQGNWQTHLGGHLFSHTSVRFSERWDNSAISYDQAFVLSVVGRVSRSWQIFRKKMTFSYQLGLPVVSFVMRPEFSGVPDFLDHETNFLSDAFQRGQWAAINRYPHIKSTLEVGWAIAEKNILKFTYQWDYYSFQDPVPVQAAGHSFLVTLLTRLK